MNIDQRRRAEARAFIALHGDLGEDVLNEQLFAALEANDDAAAQAALEISEAMGAVRADNG